MPIYFIDNYAKQNLESVIVNQDGITLYGELWVYNQFLAFEENNFLNDEIWYLKHNYNLSTHPASKRKVEGQVDFILLSKYGILVIEVKGGGLRVDENDCYFSYNTQSEYETQNPFIQSKEYVHTLKNYIDKSIFVYRAIVLPHEAGFTLRGPQLEGYKDFFFSKADIDGLNERAIQNKFFSFIKDLGIKAKIKTINGIFKTLGKEQVNNKASELYPFLNDKEIKSLKLELFPIQSAYGYNSDRINSELIFKENYEILKGLRRNRNVIIQGPPGSGKTVLAVKYLAENLLKQHRVIFYCANKLVKSKIEYTLINDYKLDSNNFSFRIFSDVVKDDSISNEIDFLIFDEAQEYFDKGLYAFIEKINNKLKNPKILILYDPDQAIISNITELAWHTDFFIEMKYSHFYFDRNYRCSQNENIAQVSTFLLHDEYREITTKHNNILSIADDLKSKIEKIRDIIIEKKFTSSEKIILVYSHLILKFTEMINDYFKTEIEELTEANINTPTNKIRFTTPIKYRGLENESVYLITMDLNSITKVENYIGATRAMSSLRIIIWK